MMCVFRPLLLPARNRRSADSGGGVSHVRSRTTNDDIYGGLVDAVDCSHANRRSRVD